MWTQRNKNHHPITAPEIDKFIGVCSKHVQLHDATKHIGIYIAHDFTQPAKDLANNSQYLVLLCNESNFIRYLLDAINEIQKLNNKKRKYKESVTLHDLKIAIL